MEDLKIRMVSLRVRKIKGEFITWPKLKGLSDLNLEIHNDIKLWLFESTFTFPNKESWSPKWVVKQAAKTRAKRKSKDK